MQVLPFFGWLIARRRNLFAHFTEVHGLALIFTVGIAYLGFVLLLVWQALHGQSVIHPDAYLLTGGLVLIALTALSAFLIATHARRTGSGAAACNSAPASSNALRT
jgi:hypothetical protein